MLLEIVKLVDEGRYLHIIVIVDSIDGYLRYGILSPDTNIEEISDNLNLRIQKSPVLFPQKEGFKQGTYHSGRMWIWSTHRFSATNRDTGLVGRVPVGS